jgi:hypothetical protein
VREELRTSTQLADERLDALVGELEAKITKIVNVAQMRAFDDPAKTAKQYDEMANALRDLIATQERVHLVVREGVGLPKSVLVGRLQVADAMAAGLRKHVKKGRPLAEGFYQRGLARAAARIIRNHCEAITKEDLRRAVAAVLIRAGYSFPEPKKNSDKFDRMLRPFRPNPSDEAAECRAKELAEKLGDHPI